MAWSLDPAAVQDPTTNVVAVFGWGDAINAAFDWLRGAKAGCHLTSVVGTTINATPTVMPWGTEFYDVNACHDTGANTERITVPSGWGGLWIVGTTLAATVGTLQVKIMVNATTDIVAQSCAGTGTAEFATACQTIYPMAVGDYFSVYAEDGTTRSTTNTSHFWAHWLHGI